MIKILDSNLRRQAVLKEAIEPNRFEEINGENTLRFSTILDEKASTYINENAVIELDNDYFDIAYYQKNQNEDGTLTIDVEAEHISYRLNDPEYDLDYFASTGAPAAVLADILNNTGFTAGTVEFSGNVTYSIQEKKSRRMMLMEFVALLGGEVFFNKFTVSILKHRGSSEPKLLTKGKNIKIISKIFNKRERDPDGNPLIAYTCEPIMLPEEPFALGDQVMLIQKDLGIQELLRIVRIGYNPYNPIEAEIELANFISGLEDGLYRIQTLTVFKDKVYNGCRIGPEEGFVAERTDGKAKTIMNATEGISIYSDTGSGLERNFFVGLDGRIQAKGLDIDDESTFAGPIKANQLLIGGENGYISFNDLTDKPDIPVLPSYIKSTYIDSTTVMSPTIIGGEIIGGSITSYSTIDVETDLRVGNNIYLGNDLSYKSINFNYGALISSAGLNINLSSDSIYLESFYLTLGQSYTSLGFFGSTGTTKQTLTLLDGSATLSDVIIKLNGLITRLGLYGLFSVS